MVLKEWELQAELARRQAAALQAKLEKAAEDAESRRVAEEGRLAEQHETLRLKLQQAQIDRSTLAPPPPFPPSNNSQAL